MKRIKINKYLEPVPDAFYTRDTFFWVCLGNSTRHKFTSKRNCLAFLAQVNRFLNNKLHEANYLYTEVFAHYRQNWFYFFHEKNIHTTNMLADQRAVENELKSVMETFELLVSRSHFPNGNYFVWVHFNSIFNSLESCCSVLYELQKKRSNGAEAQQLRILIDRVNICRNQVNSYMVPVPLNNQMDETGRIIPLALPDQEVADLLDGSA